MTEEEDQNSKKIKDLTEIINLADVVSITMLANSLLQSISSTTQTLEESTKRHLKHVINAPTL